MLCCSVGRERERGRDHTQTMSELRNLDSKRMQAEIDSLKVVVAERCACLRACWPARMCVITG